MHKITLQTITPSHFSFSSKPTCHSTLMMFMFLIMLDAIHLHLFMKCKCNKMKFHCKPAVHKFNNSGHS